MIKDIRGLLKSVKEAVTTHYTSADDPAAGGYDQHGNFVGGEGSKSNASYPTSEASLDETMDMLERNVPYETTADGVIFKDPMGEMEQGMPVPTTVTKDQFERAQRALNDKKAGNKPVPGAVDVSVQKPTNVPVPGATNPE